MAGLSDYLEDKLLNHAFRNVVYTPPATVYVGLFTAAPSDAGGGTEVATGSYARIAATFGAPSPSGTIANTGVLTFPTASASWGTVTHFGVFDALSGGNLMSWAPLTNSKLVGIGDIAVYGIGALVQNLD